VKNVLLVGATDGIGLALAGLYLERGDRVALVGRDAEKVAGTGTELAAAFPDRSLTALVCDVRDPRQVADAFDEALRRLGGLDLLVYCAGVIARGGSVEERLASAEQVLDTNVLGAIHFLERGADYLEPRGEGRLAAIGSVAGVRGRKGDPIYGASKAALHAYLEGLRHRLHPSGVGVTTVKPGFVRTRMLRDQTRHFPPAISAEDAARIIARGLDRGRDAFFVPGWWALVALALLSLPTVLYKRIAPA